MRTPEQQELASTVRALLAKRAHSAAVRASLETTDGYDKTLWKLLTEQIGAPALQIAEEFGGAGFELADALVVVEELGYALAPAPLVASLIASTAASVAGAADVLERIASGEVATLAWTGIDHAASGRFEPVRYENGVLRGTLEHVLEGDGATVLLVAASGADGTALVVVDAASVDRQRTPTMDPTLRLARLTFDDVPAAIVASDASDALAEAHRTACLCVAALEVGAAQRALDMTVNYAKEREQFGRPIGSFQALKHRMADMLVLVEMSRSALAAAIDDAGMLASASSYCAEALERIASETVQLHGGIAITWEHDAHLIFKRAHALGQLFGSAQQHRALIAL